MIILKDINGRYHSDSKFVRGLIMGFSSTGLYRDEKTMLNLIRSDAMKIGVSFMPAQQVNSDMILHESDAIQLERVKKNIDPAYTTAIDGISLFCSRFYDIRKNGGSFGTELTKKEAIDLILEIQKLSNDIRTGSENLKTTLNIKTLSINNDLQLLTVLDKINYVINVIEKNYKTEIAEFKKYMFLFHTGLLNNQNFHCM